MDPPIVWISLRKKIFKKCDVGIKVCQLFFLGACAKMNAMELFLESYTLFSDFKTKQFVILHWQ